MSMIINISELLSTTEKTESYSVPLECNAFNIHGQDYRIIEKAPVELTIKNTGVRTISIDGRVKVVVVFHVTDVLPVYLRILTLRFIRNWI